MLESVFCEEKNTIGEKKHCSTTDAAGGLVLASGGPREPRRRLPPCYQRPRLLHGPARRTSATGGAPPPPTPRPATTTPVSAPPGGSCSTSSPRATPTSVFVNATTGRFLRRSTSSATTTCGFLVLADREPPHAATVLNPFAHGLHA